MRLPRITRQWVLALFLIASVVTAFLGPKAAATLRNVARYALLPLTDGPMYLTAAFKSGLGRAGGDSISAEEARRLREENEELKAALFNMYGEREEFRQQVADIQKIRQAYSPKGDFPCELIPARVAAADALPYGRTRLLDYGAPAGSLVTTRILMTDRAKALPPNLAAISAQSLAGRIISSGEYSSLLQLVTDRGFEIDEAQIWRIIDPNHPRQIKITRSGAARVETLTPANLTFIPVRAQGDGAGAVIVRDVSVNHSVRPGDWLMTRRESRFLPADIPIGRVAEVRDDPKGQGLRVILRVQPLADLESLRDVFIVRPLGEELIAKPEKPGGKR